MKRIDYSKNEEYRTMIIGVLPMDSGYKLLWQDNVFLEDVDDLKIYIDNSEVLQNYINECFRNTYDGICFSKLYAVSISSTIENNWGTPRDMIKCINPVGRIDRGNNKFFCQEMSSVDRDRVNCDINLSEL